MAEAWAERTALEQGLSVKVQDPATLRVVATLLAAGRSEATRIRPAARRG
jgi:hypothetical protein